MDYNILYKGWLKRQIEFVSPDANYLVTYSGRGIGTESVSVNDAECTHLSSEGWFVPSFQMKNNIYNINVEVRVWPWLAIRSILIKINGKEAYNEGGSPYKVTKLTELGNMLAFLMLFPGLLYLIAELLH